MQTCDQIVGVMAFSMSKNDYRFMNTTKTLRAQRDTKSPKDILKYCLVTLSGHSV